ncbi:uncharacterized protein GIQ15_01661 [Arthroderma uncinatum]|uniref:uncharacterized protein n=1 Tax=Arthroderma uncinatum TaxID=74035 RepID=UPI00144AD3B3|nr:uncharacterized protein GIQ15_01661 [Arthroderma uncinatum]KAF3492144.1 hypothetical protein GIQ15_01661 [Arthroderma uncinatum]
MRAISLAIAFCTFVATVSADYTIITSSQYGLNVTLNGAKNGIELDPGSPCRYWDAFQAAKGVKDWYFYRISSSGVTGYLRYLDYRTGTIAKVDRIPTLFQVEADGHGSYLVALESETPGQRLAWTVEHNDSGTTGGNMVLKLRPYERSESQRFKFTQQYVEETHC